MKGSQRLAPTRQHGSTWMSTIFDFQRVSCANRDSPTGLSKPARWGGRLWRPKGFDHFGDSDGSKTALQRYGDDEVRLIDFSQGRSTADCLLA